jgi:cyclopropane fatty-acyl-phospholipid synthase-like methyltransferase
MTEFQHSGVQDSDRFRSLRQKVDSSDYAVEEIVKELGVEEGMTILDFGCGEGSLLLKYYAPLAEAKNARVVGIDISKSQIELAKKYNTHPRVEYLCGNILSNADNPLVGRKFDRIVSVWVLDYFMDYA